VIYSTATVPVNPAGEPRLTREQVWKGLALKARDARLFLPPGLCTRCDIVEESATHVVREATIAGSDLREIITLERNRKVTFFQATGPREGAIINELFFDFVAAEDVLPKILTGYGMVPGVASTSDISGPWDRPGSHRIVHLADGSTARERVTHHDRPAYFACRVSDPSFALKHLMTEARGEFWFTSANGGTQVKWTYSFGARNWLAKIPLTLFVKTQWKGYMDVCLANVIKYFVTLDSRN
jgi:hypothetical protein